MSDLLTQFETDNDLRKSEAATVLGVASVTYHQWHSKLRPIMKHTVLHIEALNALDPAVRKKIIGDRLL